ncbi:MAG: helix-turn-helix domain-containing protein [Bacteroidetes bacterium]|nr:MAG: helix-turn-helix domain-containing protein [Bacteroidota bacterium]
MAKKAEKKIAMQLFIATNKSQKEIAEQIGVSEHTLSKWVNEGNWHDIKTAKTLTRESLLSEAYRRLEKINQKIEDDYDGLPDKKTNDAKSTILREIQTLEKDDSLALTISVMERFTRFVAQRDFQLSKSLSQISMEFLETRANEYN